MFHELEGIKTQIKDFSAEEVLLFAKHNFSDGLVFASSFGLEDQVILDMIMRNNLKIEIFTLDTGRLFPETYQLIEQTEKKYDCKVKVYFPKNESVEKMVNQHGVNSFYKSIALRKECCQIRKLEPLSRALANSDAWICGLRKEQAVTRSDVNVIELDNNERFKINPLFDWNEERMWDYIKKYDVPYNELHDKNFPSIGCASCTRAIADGEDIRNGRWWWETPEQKECGLHIVDGKLQRIKK
ncbi:phosphoadenylyl-sulfate reductase [Lentisphaerota bacterium WC36G]|nr:phosphoadenylyl-sulfate reductase [Lentisphaerae bacterium WC36]